MKTLIIGAAGMIGRKLTEQLYRNGQLNGQPLSELILADIAKPDAQLSEPLNTSIIVNAIAADLTADKVAEQLVAHEPDIIYHLAAIVSGEAEADFDKGYRINLDGTRTLLDAIRTRHGKTGYTPKLIFASSLAVYGAPFPDTIDDEFHLTPLTSYGTHKAISELLLADYTRRGFLHAVGLRLPTICIRPGLPNKAASGFFSNILREPINGMTAILPVKDSVRHWFASPRAAVGFLIHASSLSNDQLGPRCSLTMPGLSATVAEQIDALQRIAGNDALQLIQRVPDPAIHAIVANWPESFNAQRAAALGFTAESSFDEIIQVYLEDDRPAPVTT